MVSKYHLSLSLLTLLTAGALTSTSARAQQDESWTDNLYLGTFYSWQSIEVSPGNDREPEAFGVMFGYQFNDYFSLEARVSDGTSGFASKVDLPEFPDAEYTEDLGLQTGLFARANYSILDSVQVYGLIGYVKSDYDITTSTTRTYSDGNVEITYPTNITESESGLAYGVGIQMSMDDHFDIFLDYQKMPDLSFGNTSGFDWDGTTIGVVYSF